MNTNIHISHVSRKKISMYKLPYGAKCNKQHQHYQMDQTGHMKIPTSTFFTFGPKSNACLCLSDIPFVRRSQCTSAGCCGTDRAQGHAQSQTGHTRWSMAAGLSAWLPVGNQTQYSENNIPLHFYEYSILSQNCLFKNLIICFCY